jgi:hypothetical protein
MPIPWLTVLQNVPWTEVISNAPKVADGAKKLWGAVTKKPLPPSTREAEVPAALSPEAQARVALEAKVSALESAVADLHGQMLASSELIKALADQNAQLIGRIESNRVRLAWLSAALGIVVALVLAGVVFLWRQQHV